MRLSSSSKTSHSRLAKMSGRMNVLYLGASFAPRMEHAASQIQDSRDLSGGSGTGVRLANRAAVGKTEFVRDSTPHPQSLSPFEAEREDVLRSLRSLAAIQS